jgi:hypothetical protein
MRDERPRPKSQGEGEGKGERSGVCVIHSSDSDKGDRYGYPRDPVMTSFVEVSIVQGRVLHYVQYMYTCCSPYVLNHPLSS